MARRWSTLLLLVILTAAYVAAGKLGLSLAYFNASASPVWPPTGMALAAMLLLGYRIWPAVLVGAFIVNLTTAGTVPASVAIAGGNLLEVLAGTMLARRLAGGCAAFESAPNIFRFTFLAALPSTMACATIGVGALASAGLVARGAYGDVWMTWWTGDFISALLLTPLLLIWIGPAGRSSGMPAIKLGRALEITALAGLLLGAGALVFSQRNLLNAPGEALAYLPVLPLIWAAFRFEQWGATAAAFVLAAIAVSGTLSGAGPFATGDPNDSLLLLQTFLAANTLTALLLGAVVSERALADLEKERILQREQAARGEAENANRAKDQFLAVLSHELRTPLTPILLAASMLEGDPALPADLREDAQMIRRNAELEARLIDDLLDLTRITRGKLQMNVAIRDVHEVVQRAVQISCADREGDLTLHLNAIRHHVRGDPARLLQVFWNLLRNAVKFTPRGKPIEMRTSNPSQDAIDIVVADKGMGIEPEALPRLFDAFEQGSAARMSKFGGLGLGLTITKALVEAHGGTIIAQSAGHDAGATFTVRLPLAAAPGESDDAPPTAVQPAAAPAGARILLVEDHAETLETTARALMRLGHKVTTATTIAAAMESASHNRFDLLISDLGLPDGMGFELMRMLAARHHLPGIALSGYGLSDDIRQSRAAGFAEHLVKPVDLNVLEQTIAGVLASDHSARG